MRKRNILTFVVAASVAVGIGVPTAATNYYVDGTNGDDNYPGTLAEPFATIGKGLSMGGGGDQVIVRTGSYTERLTFPNGGTGEADRLVLRAYTSETVTVVKPVGREHIVAVPYVTVQDLVFDGGYHEYDIIAVNTGGDSFVISGCELKETIQEGITLYDVSDVLIDNCEIHHCLRGSFIEQADAHGIRGDKISNITIRGTEVYYVSGDAFQASPNRDWWDNVYIENCHFWDGPLPADAAGFYQGEVPGENAIDTKARKPNPACHLYVSDSIFNGWRDGPITNMAALNLKEKIDAVVERCLLYDNNISYRYRGGNPGSIILNKNCITFGNVQAALRHEDKIGTNLRMYNSTFGENEVGCVFYEKSAVADPAVDTLNCAFLGVKPSEANDPSNLSLVLADFVDPVNGDYHLAEGSDAIDAGTTLAAVTVDYDQVGRPQGDYYDVGAYEYISGPTLPRVEFDLASSNDSESVASVNLAVSLSNSSDQTVTVDYAVTGGTADDPNDYTIAGTQLSFSPGVTTQYVPITVVDDGEVESDETIEVTLSNPTNATLGVNMVHTYTINDDDGTPPPGQASNPSPTDGETKVPISGTILSWTAGAGATSHDVYFGTNPTPGPSELQGNQTDTTFDPGDLVKLTMYYWRIDEVNESGTTTGVVWSFKTSNK